jgi:hypothetical protein
MNNLKEGNERRKKGRKEELGMEEERDGRREN